ncbi:MAG: hypothetical protein ACRDLL_00975 [Solirubrobacterales bacterium]
MKRALMAIAVAITLALPSTANAFFSEFYSGPVGNGVNNAGVEFKAHFHNKRAFEAGKDPSKVVNFHWFNVPITTGCFDSLTDNGFDMHVNDLGKFHGNFAVPQTNRTAKVTGKFKNHNRKVVGTLRLKGSFNGCANADSGTLGWVAHHGGSD